MYSIITKDKDKDLILGTFKTHKDAKRKLKDFKDLFSIPLERELLDYYKKNAYIKDTERGYKFIPIYR